MIYNLHSAGWGCLVLNFKSFNFNTLTKVMSGSGLSEVCVESSGKFDIDIVLNVIRDRKDIGHIDKWFLNMEKSKLFPGFKVDFADLLNKYNKGGNLFAYARK